MFLALYLGLRETLFIGGLMYLAAMVLVHGRASVPVQEP